MNKIKLYVWFYDGEDLSSGEWCTAEDAWKEDFIKFDGAELVPTDECSIIVISTGLKDKNGEEIGAGDIWRPDSWHAGWEGDGYLVEACDNAGFFPFTFGVDQYGYATFGERSEEGVLVGNIYENPELKGVTK